MGNESILGFVMAGGNGNRLKILTKNRCKPAINILGSYKVFDFVASNIVNTGIPVALVATQYKPESLREHIKRAWAIDGFGNRFDIINSNENNIPIFEGTADSVRKSMDHIDRYNPDTIVVFSADHIYFMDYENAIIQHNIHNADITIMTNAIPDSKVSDFGIVKIDEYGRIIDFAEKPTDQETIESFRLSPGIKNCLCIEDPKMNFLASMGNYIFHRDRLKKFLDYPGVDFGKDIIPAIKANGGSLYAYIFSGYWRDIGKVSDYFDCNMEFTRKPMSILRSWIGTLEENLPPPQVDKNSTVNRTILSFGDIIRQKNTIADSVLGQDVVTEEGCEINHCVLLGSETNRSINTQTDKGECAIHIGKDSHLDHVILDRNTWVGRDVDINPKNGTPERRQERLQNIGLKPYRELDNGAIEGDFYIEPETGILVIGEQQNVDQQNPILPDGLRC